MAIRTRFRVPEAEKQTQMEHKDFPDIPLPNIVAGEFIPWKGWFFKVVAMKDMQILMKLERPTGNKKQLKLKDLQRLKREGALRRQAVEVERVAKRRTTVERIVK